MEKFDERKKSFEKKFAHDEELKFKVAAKRNKYLGQWASQKLGYDAEKEKEYIPDGGNQVIVHTKLIGGGESDTITFDAPEKGTYEFICSFPGHYMSMKGKLIIK